MTDHIRLALMRQPVGGIGRRIVFGVLALVLFISELVWGAAIIGGSVLSVEGALATYIALAIVGWLPATGGTLFVVITASGVLLPFDLVSLALPLLGMYAVAVDWISRGWFIATGLALVAVEGAQLVNSSDLLADVVGMVLGVAFAVAVGLGLRWNQSRIASLETDAQAAREAEASVRRDLTAGLHDTVATDLVRIIVTSQSIAQKTTDRASAGQILQLGELARGTMQHVRSLMAQIPSNPPDAEEPIASVLATCQTMLTERGIVLEAELPEDIDTSHPSAMRHIVANAIREGATNVLKYAEDGTSANLTVENLPSGGVSMAMASDTATSGLDADSAWSGGSGLDSLARRVRAAGGTIDFGPKGSTWLLSIELPPESPATSKQQTPGGPR